MVYKLNSKQDYLFAYDMIVFINNVTGIPEDNITLVNHSIVVNDEELILYVNKLGKNVDTYKQYLITLMQMFADGYDYE